MTKASGSQAVTRNHGGHQLVSVQAAFHKDFSPAFAHERDGARGRRHTIFSIDDLDFAKI
jgi:hypothetical protein